MRGGKLLLLNLTREYEFENLARGRFVAGILELHSTGAQIIERGDALRIGAPGLDGGVEGLGGRGDAQIERHESGGLRAACLLRERLEPSAGAIKLLRGEKITNPADLPGCQRILR